MTPILPKLQHWTDPFPKGKNWVVCVTNIQRVALQTTPWLTPLIGRGSGWFQMVPL